jgi:hypothetical protein
MKPYVYVTSEDSLTTYLLLNNNNRYEKKHVFVPTLFEQMSHR